MEAVTQQTTPPVVYFHERFLPNWSYHQQFSWQILNNNLFELTRTSPPLLKSMLRPLISKNDLLISAFLHLHLYTSKWLPFLVFLISYAMTARSPSTLFDSKKARHSLYATIKPYPFSATLRPSKKWNVTDKVKFSNVGHSVKVKCSMSEVAWSPSLQK